MEGRMTDYFKPFVIGLFTSSLSLISLQPYNIMIVLPKAQLWWLPLSTRVRIQPRIQCFHILSPSLRYLSSLLAAAKLNDSFFPKHSLHLPALFLFTENT